MLQWVVSYYSRCLGCYLGRRCNLLWISYHGRRLPNWRHCSHDECGIERSTYPQDNDRYLDRHGACISGWSRKFSYMEVDDGRQLLSPTSLNMERMYWCCVTIIPSGRKEN